MPETLRWTVFGQGYKAGRALRRLLSGIAAGFCLSLLTACGGGTAVSIGGTTNGGDGITLLAPATGSVGNALILSATAGNTSLIKIEFFDGTSKIGEDSDSPYEVTWVPLGAGVHKLLARATDTAGTPRSSPEVLINISAGSVDTQAPTATLTAPGNLAAGLNGIVTLTADAHDNVGVAAVEFEVDGISLGSVPAPYQTRLDTSAYPAGQHVVRARAQDAAGNLSEWSQALVQFAGSGDVPRGFSKNESWVTGLTRATAFAQAADGRWFIAEQDGRLRVVKNGSLLAAPFVQLSVDSNGERGLIGVALHPDFASNGWVYLYYTSTQNGPHNRISRFVANGDVANAGETVLVDLPPLSSATNHNGGALHFGIDGKLYVGVGDNANGMRAQNLAEPFGKMLRFNDDGSIPADNPFYASQSGIARAVWAYGLRNPFTFAIQPGSGRLYINDVGEDTWEEINLGAAGANYGWPSSEGPDRIAAGMSAPLFAYKHRAGVPPGSGPGGFITGFSIAGGAFYPVGGTFPAAYRGNYFFADYISSFVARLDLANNNAVYTFARLSGNPVDLRAGTDGALYVLTRDKLMQISAP